MDHEIKKPARLQRLHGLSIQVRQIVIGRLDDLQAWRVSTLLRDATTPAEADEAERQLKVWESLALQGEVRAGSERISS
ncbi:hypothetical protein [Tardiphaga robiniae]|uniref:hypothetical protein n=1 Tax=Tardiphaga robiniae TaxID=943830 RepID=UPI001112A7F8|nr:hypothetical protein [Tardiphaga robiniae]